MSDPSSMTTALTWISEATALPKIGQVVFLATPRQSGEFWDISAARLSSAHEDVSPRPVSAGERWPTDFFWSRSHIGGDTSLVTGNGWWASMVSIPLPPGAVHCAEGGYDLVRQAGECFKPMECRKS